MELLVKRIETDQPDCYDNPFDLVSCNRDGGHSDGFVEHRCKLAIVYFCNIDGQDTVLEQNYPEALVTLKSDSPDKGSSRLLLIFNLVDTQDTSVVR
jgi:hypothetical protein